MPIYQTLPTTEALDDRIYKVAASLQDVPHAEASKKKGVSVFEYEKSEECFALSHEYIKGSWPIVQQAMKEVKLEQPKKRPTVLQQQTGWLSTASSETGVIIPIRNREDKFEKDSIELKGVGHIKLAPHAIIVLEGDVGFHVSNRVSFNLILHPTSPAVEQLEVRET